MKLLHWLHYHLINSPEGAPASLPPPSGVKYALYHDPVEDGDDPLAGSGFQTIVDAGGGLVHLQTADGRYLSQEPNQYGVFGLATEAKAYETFGREAGLVTTWTRPAEGDRIFHYVLVRLPNAA
jgi:hypothetical protein